MACIRFRKVFVGESSLLLIVVSFVCGSFVSALFTCVCSTVMLNQKWTKDHRYKKGHAPRALHDGALIHGHLKATIIVGTTNLDLLQPVAGEKKHSR